MEISADLRNLMKRELSPKDIVTELYNKGDSESVLDFISLTVEEIVTTKRHKLKSNSYLNLDAILTKFKQDENDRFSIEVFDRSPHVEPSSKSKESTMNARAKTNTVKGLLESYRKTQRLTMPCFSFKFKPSNSIRSPVSPRSNSQSTAENDTEKSIIDLQTEAYEDIKPQIDSSIDSNSEKLPNAEEPIADYISEPSPPAEKPSCLKPQELTTQVEKVVNDKSDSESDDNSFCESTRKFWVKRAPIKLPSKSIFQIIDDSITKRNLKRNSISISKEEHSILAEAVNEVCKVADVLDEINPNIIVDKICNKNTDDKISLQQFDTQTDLFSITPSLVEDNKSSEHVSNHHVNRILPDCNNMTENDVSDIEDLEIDFDEDDITLEKFQNIDITNYNLKSTSSYSSVTEKSYSKSNESISTYQNTNEENIPSNDSKFDNHKKTDSSSSFDPVDDFWGAYQVPSDVSYIDEESFEKRYGGQQIIFETKCDDDTSSDTNSVSNDGNISKEEVSNQQNSPSSSKCLNGDQISIPNSEDTKSDSFKPIDDFWGTTTMSINEINCDSKPNTISDDNMQNSESIIEQNINLIEENNIYNKDEMTTLGSSSSVSRSGELCNGNQISELDAHLKEDSTEITTNNESELERYCWNSSDEGELRSIVGNDQEQTDKQLWFEDCSSLENSHNENLLEVLNIPKLSLEQEDDFDSKRSYSSSPYEPVEDFWGVGDNSCNFDLKEENIFMDNRHQDFIVEDDLSTEEAHTKSSGSFHPISNFWEVSEASDADNDDALNENEHNEYITGEAKCEVSDARQIEDENEPDIIEDTASSASFIPIEDFWGTEYIPDTIEEPCIIKEKMWFEDDNELQNNEEAQNDGENIPNSKSAQNGNEDVTSGTEAEQNDSLENEPYSTEAAENDNIENISSSKSPQNKKEENITNGSKLDQSDSLENGPNDKIAIDPDNNSNITHILSEEDCNTNNQTKEIKEPNESLIEGESDYKLEDSLIADKNNNCHFSKNLEEIVNEDNSSPNEKVQEIYNSYITYDFTNEDDDLASSSEDEEDDQNYRKLYTDKTWDPLLLWFRPLRCCLNDLVTEITSSNITEITSVGCGSGLLEWLIWKETGLSVTGYEVNQSWWTSEYSPPMFIPHVYVDEVSSTFHIIPKSHALLFCYFNNGKVFKDYLKRYRGPLLIIIGPINGSLHTNPLPLDLIDSPQWILKTIHQQQCGNVIAFYVRR